MVKQVGQTSTIKATNVLNKMNGYVDSYISK